MKNIYFFVLLFCINVLSGSVYSQNELPPCSANEMMAERLKQHPELLQEVEQQENYTQTQLAANVGKKMAMQVYTIPVVFHVIHNFGVENISDAVILDAMSVLNADFRRTGDRSAIVSSFQSLDADCEIEFKLAQLDPSGNCTNGIDRVASTKTNNADDYSKLNPWPRDKYLNVWVVASIANGSAGGAYVPSMVNSSPNIDGVLIRYDYVGQNAPSTINRSHALTHEVGHMFNLNHTWGTTNNIGVACGDDGVTDTPITKGWGNCLNLTAQVCNSGITENVQNYMEYSYCHPRMFTTDQKSRMVLALNSCTAKRCSLWVSTNLIATGTDGTPAVNCTPKADFTSNKKTVCLGGSVNFFDYSFNTSSVTGWNWSFPGGSPSSSTAKNPTGITYSTPGKYNVSLTSSGSAGTGAVTTKSNYIIVYDNSNNTGPYTEGFESYTFPSTKWDVYNPDSYKTWADCNTAAATGSKSIKLDNIGNILNALDYTISPTIDMTKISTKTLTFKVAFAQYTSTDADLLRVLVSTDCGQTGTQVYSKTGTTLKTVSPQTAAFTPSSSAHWRTETVNLTSYGSYTNLQLIFEFTFKGGNNIYLDDINIGGLAAIDEEDEKTFNLSVYPNPLNEVSVVQFETDIKEKVSITVYDLVGKNASIVLNDTELNAGAHKYSIDPNSLKLSKGIYFIELKVGKDKVVKKLLIN